MNELPEQSTLSIKSTEEIIDYYRSCTDWLGFTAEVLLHYLSAEQAKQFFKDNADLSQWQQLPLTREHVITAMKEYMEFAWTKAVDHRGISASRSVEKMCAWLWLLCDDETLAFARSDDNYAQYGAPVLKRICEAYGFPVPAGEDVERMAKGLHCTPDCEEGCGR